MPTEYDAALALIVEAFERERSPGVGLVPEPTLIASAEVVAGNEQAAEELASRIFQPGVPMDLEFYDVLHKLERRVGFSPQTARLAEEVSVHALKKMNEEQRRNTLNALAGVAGNRFFEALRRFPTIIAKINFDPRFVVPWFLRVRKRIGNDLAQGDFWQTVETWSLCYPDDGFLGLRSLLTTPLDDNLISLAACILGILRVTWESKDPNDADRALEASLIGDTDVKRRLVFHRSWINTGWKRNLTTDEFATCLQRMETGTEEERAEGFNFLCRLLPSDNITQESFHYGAKWLAANANSSISNDCKHLAVGTAHMVALKNKLDGVVLKLLCDSLVTIQPVPKENAGTWNTLEGFLVGLIKRDAATFQVLFFRLFDVNSDGVMHYLTAAKGFEWLLSEIPAHIQPGWYGGLFFSIKRSDRQLAFTLFDELPFDRFTDRVLELRSDAEIALALLEFRLNRLSPEHVATFLSALLSRAQGGSDSLKQLYEDELFYQAKNLPGACLENLKLLAARSELVASVVKAAEAYFAALRKCHDGPPVSMEIPGLQRGLRIQASRQSRQVHELSREMSVFANLFPTSYLLYGGKTYRICRDGELGEVDELQAFSAQSELPRLEIIDPEGSAIRRHNAIESIRKLEANLAVGRGDH